MPQVLDTEKILNNRYRYLTQCQDMELLKKVLLVFGNSIGIAPFLKTPESIVSYMEKIGKLVAGDHFHLLIGACYDQVLAQSINLKPPAKVSEFPESQIPADLS